jgi:oxygen-independent coproporphyrinogen III oxidase
MTFGLYVHYPYCQRVCPYCDFCVASNRAPQNEAYTEALSREMQVRAGRFADFGELTTVYIGGGTPSLWPVDLLERWLNKVRTHFQLSKDVEVTLELNPEDANLDHLKAIRDMGVNRLSIGAQSLDDDVLRRLGRSHRKNDVIRCVELVRTAGFTNWNVDLIHGLVGQSLASVLLDVRRILDLDTPHLSTYQLTVEPGTPFGQREERGETLNVDEGLLVAMYQAIINLNETNGRIQYEISNAASPGFESRHNLGYWMGRPYLALGTGAHGFCPKVEGAERYANHAGVRNYITSVSRANDWLDLPCEMTQQTADECIEDQLMTGLRLQCGIEPTRKMEDCYGQTVQILVNEGLMTAEAGRWSASKKGRMVLDFVIERILSDSMVLT